MFVIKRIDQGGGYVARAGSTGSYTKNIEKAEIYRTREQAENNRCPENEIIIAILDILTPTIG